MKATRNISRETIDYDANTGIVVIDSIFKGQDQKGTIVHPSSWGAGFMFEGESMWMFGAEIGLANWADYKYFGTADKMINNWTGRIGGQFVPDYKSSNYWQRVAYRLGASFGPDNVQLNRSIPQYMFSFGTGLPVRRNVYTNQYTTINTAFELGFRGNKSNDIRENIFRFSLGLNLSDIWFNKPKYQ